MDYLTYKTIHIFSALLLLFALGGLVLRALESGAGKTSARKLASITHGIALVLLLVSGFGAMAKLGLDHGAGFPTWILLKLLLWLAFGGVLYFIHRKPATLKALWFVLPLLAGLAGALALYKP